MSASEQRCRFAVVGPTFPFRGGVSHFATLMVRALRERHQVLFVSLSRLYPTLLYPGGSQRDSSQQPITEEAVRLIHPLSPGTWWMAAKQIARFEPQLCVVHYWHPFFAAATGALLRLLSRQGVPTALMCHQVLPPEAIPGQLPLTRWTLKAANVVLVPSRAEQERLYRVCADVDSVVAPYPSLEPLLGGEPLPSIEAARRDLNLTGYRVLVYFGIIRRSKGVDVLIRALAKVRGLDNLRLVIAGEPMCDMAALRRLAQRQGVHDKIRFEARYIPNEEVPNLLAAADALVLPYRSSSGSGVAQLALEAGKPVIASEVGALGELITHGQTGLLVPPEEPAALARAIEEFYEGRLVIKAGAQLQRLRVGARIEEFERLLLDLCQRDQNGL